MFAVEEGKIRYALAALKGVGEGAMEKIVAERRANGAYKDMDDFLSRIDPRAMNKRQFEGLINAGAFDCFGHDRALLHGNAEMMLRHASSLAEERESGQSSLFGGDATQSAMPPLQDVEGWDNLERLSQEFSAVGFYLSAHPLDSRLEQLENMGVVAYANAAQAVASQKSNRLHMAGILIRKQERVSAKTGNKFAFLQLSDATGVYEVMVFSDTLARCREFLEPGRGLLVRVDTEVRDEELSFLAQNIEPLDEAVADKVRELRIHIDASEPVQRIYDGLKIAGQGMVKIYLHAYLPDGHVAEMEIPGRHTIPPEMLSMLQKTPGFVKYRES
jgi:DNA polymerase-3 subunit alpha